MLTRPNVRPYIFPARLILIRNLAVIAFVSLSLRYVYGIQSNFYVQCNGICQNIHNGSVILSSSSQRIRANNDMAANNNKADVETKYRLLYALSAQADNDKNVALVFSSWATRSLLCNVLSSARNVQPAMTNLLVVALDMRTAQFCHENSFPVFEYPVSLSESESSKFQNVSLYKRLIKSKQHVILWSLQLRYNILSVDTDVVFLQNFFTAIPEISKFDVTAQGVHCKSIIECEGICGGLFFMQANRRTVALTWKSINLMQQGEFHQPSINNAARNISGLSVQIIPTIYMPFVEEYGYFCHGFRNRTAAVLVHASQHDSCANSSQWYLREVTIAGKIAELQSLGLFSECPAVSKTCNVLGIKDDVKPRYGRCKNALFDLGANNGDTILRFFNLTSEFANSDKNKGFSGYMKALGISPSEFCILSFEGNADYTDTLRSMEVRYAAEVIQFYLFTSTVISTVDGPVVFYIDRVNPSLSVGSSLLLSKTTSSLNTSAVVDGVDFGRILTEVSTPVHRNWQGKVVVKMDIEGFEYFVLRNLAARGLLCGFIDALIIEFHDKNEKMPAEKGLPDDVDVHFKWLFDDPACKTQLVMGE
jgi:hypothetical protein